MFTIWLSFIISTATRWVHVYNDSRVCYCNRLSLLLSFHILHTDRSHIASLIHSRPPITPISLSIKYNIPTLAYKSLPSDFSLYYSKCTSFTLLFSLKTHQGYSRHRTCALARNALLQVSLWLIPSLHSAVHSNTTWLSFITIYQMVHTPLTFFAFYSIFFFFLSVILDWQIYLFKHFFVNCHPFLLEYRLH